MVIKLPLTVKLCPVGENKSKQELTQLSYVIGEPECMHIHSQMKLLNKVWTSTPLHVKLEIKVCVTTRTIRCNFFSQKLCKYTLFAIVVHKHRRIRYVCTWFNQGRSNTDVNFWTNFDSKPKTTLLTIFSFQIENSGVYVITLHFHEWHKQYVSSGQTIESKLAQIRIVRNRCEQASENLFIFVIGWTKVWATQMSTSARILQTTKTKTGENKNQLNAVYAQFFDWFWHELRWL